MRNLKRALSLALASVMVMGMMVVGSGASYKDVSSKNNQEAIEVLQAVGVMVGDENGNFNPDQKVTRNEMAVVMANLLELGVKDYVGVTNPFTDVPAWAAPYVAACKADGIVAGYSATYFGGSDSVNAVQASLMLMKALGYFQYNADFEQDWQLATVKQASKIDLYDGVETGATSPLTRNQVAQLVLNALEADKVDFDGTIGSNITTSDGTSIQIGYKAEYASLKAKTGVNYNKADGDSDSAKALQLCEDLYGKDLTKKTGDPDKFGRPSTKWEYKNDDVGTYADAADYVVVLEKAYKAADIETPAQQIKILRDLTNNNDLKYHTVGATNDVKLETNGIGDNKAAGAVPGTTLEIYCDEDNSDVIKTVVATQWAVAKIDKVDTKLTAAEKKDDVTAKLTLKDLEDKSVGTFKDTKIEGYNEDTYTKGEYIAYVENADNEIIGSYVVKTVEGKATAKGDNYIKMNGEKYLTAVPANVELGEEYTLFLDENGIALGFDGVEATSIDDVYYVANVYDETNKGRTTWYAEAVALDGTIENLKLDGEVDDFEAGLYTLVEEDGKYTLDADIDSDYDVYEGTLKDSVAKDDTKLTVKTSATTEKKAYIGKDTQFVSVKNEDNEELKVKAATGMMTASASSVDVAYLITKDGKSDALYVMYVGTEVSSAVSTGDVVFVAEESSEQNEDGWTTELYFMEDGSSDTVTVDGNSAAKVGFYTYTVDEDDIYTLKQEDVTNLSKVEDSSTGWIRMKIDSTHGDVLTGFKSADGIVADDVKFGDATVIDLRDEDTIDESTISEINSAADLADAVDSVGANKIKVVAYVDDGEIIFIAVEEVANAK